jgi:hypothetical protein
VVFGAGVVVVVLPAGVVVVLPGGVVVVLPAGVVVPADVVVVVVVVGVVVGCGVVVKLAAATCINASMLRSAMAKDTTIGPTNAPVPISRFRVARFLSSSPSRAASRFRLFSSIFPPATLLQITLAQLAGQAKNVLAKYVHPKDVHPKDVHPKNVHAASLSPAQGSPRASFVPYLPLIVQGAIDALYGAIVVAQRKVKALGAAHQCGDRPDRGTAIGAAHSQFRYQGLGHHHRRHGSKR